MKRALLIAFVACVLGACDRGVPAPRAAAQPAALPVPSAAVAPPADLALVATHVSRQPELSYATLRDRRTGGGGFYAVGDEVPAVGRVVVVAERRLVIERPSGARVALEQVGK